MVIEDEQNDGSQYVSNSTGFSLMEKIRNFTGNKTLDQQTLEPILETLQRELQARNVANDVASKIIQNLRLLCKDKKTSSFTSVYNHVKNSLFTAVKTILTFERNIDLINDALEYKKRNELSKHAFKPFIIVFCGVNGVGKSTNMAKVAYRLKVKAGLSVMIAACDTFRAGAVEQVKKHAKVLEVRTFDKG